MSQIPSTSEYQDLFDIDGNLDRLVQKIEVLKLYQSFKYRTRKKTILFI